jgi:hypothetical protein
MITSHMVGSQGEASGGTVPDVAAIVKDTLVGLLGALLMAALGLAFDHTELGEAVSRAVAAAMHQELDARAADVVIADITYLGRPAATADGLPMVPREDLSAVVDALVEVRSAAIGIDVDMSPEHGDWIDPRDPDLFAKWLALSTRQHDPVPIFVGVHRTASEPPERWLGEARFEPLAAFLGLSPPGDSLLCVPTWWQPSGSASPLPGLAMALAGATEKVIREPREIWPRLSLITARSGRTFQTATASEVIVDCSAAERLIDSRIDVRTADAVRSARDRFENRIVLVGHGGPNDARDAHYLLPGMKQTASAIYVHGCATSMLRSGTYVYRPTTLGRFALDLAFSLVVLVPVMIVRLLARRSTWGKLRTGRVELVARLLSVALALALGTLLVGVTRLLWDGFFLVALLAFVHIDLAEMTRRWIGWLRGTFFEPAGGAETS